MVNRDHINNVNEISRPHGMKVTWGACGLSKGISPHLAPAGGYHVGM